MYLYKPQVFTLSRRQGKNTCDGDLLDKALYHSLVFLHSANLSDSGLSFWIVGRDGEATDTAAFNNYTITKGQPRKVFFLSIYTIMPASLAIIRLKEILQPPPWLTSLLWMGGMSSYPATMVVLTPLSCTADLLIFILMPLQSCTTVVLRIWRLCEKRLAFCREFLHHGTKRVRKYDQFIMVFFDGMMWTNNNRHIYSTATIFFF